MESLEQISASTLPVVALLCRIPIIAEALAGAFEGLAETRSFPSKDGDTAGVLRWLRPDAVVVDNEDAAKLAAPYALEDGSLLAHVSVSDGTVALFVDGSWEVADVDGSSPEAIRNLVIGSLLRKVGA